MFVTWSHETSAVGAGERFRDCVQAVEVGWRWRVNISRLRDYSAISGCSLSSVNIWVNDNNGRDNEADFLTNTHGDCVLGSDANFSLLHINCQET